ncbi:hypothetical protein [Streptomyces parvus]
MTTPASPRAGDPASALDTAIGGAFELKVPDGLPVAEWHKK